MYPPPHMTCMYMSSNPTKHHSYISVVYMHVSSSSHDMHVYSGHDDHTRWKSSNSKYLRLRPGLWSHDPLTWTIYHTGRFRLGGQLKLETSLNKRTELILDFFADRPGRPKSQARFIYHSVDCHVRLHLFHFQSQEESPSVLFVFLIFFATFNGSFWKDAIRTKPIFSDIWRSSAKCIWIGQLLAGVLFFFGSLLCGVL